MPIHEHADKRALRFYSTGFVGTGHGDNGTSRMTHWDSMHEDLRPTAIVMHVTGIPVCAYCGNRALPIQDSVSFNTHGYTCCCKYTMDELEWRKAYSELLESQAVVRKALEENAPKVNKQIIQRLMDYSHQATVKRLEEVLPKSEKLSPYGISFTTPLDHFTRR